MIRLALLAVAAVAAFHMPTPAAPMKASITGPKVFFIAHQGHGQAMAPSFTYTGFGETAAFDAHTGAQGVEIRDLVAEDGKLRFAMSYANTAPNNFEIILYASNGQGTNLERHRVEVRRSN